MFKGPKIIYFFFFWVSYTSHVTDGGMGRMCHCESTKKKPNIDDISPKTLRYRVLGSSERAM